MMTSSALPAAIPHHRILPRIYRNLLTLTRKHGLFTLARFHQRFFGGMQRVVIPGGGSLIIPDDPHYFGFLAGVHEQHVEELIRRSVGPGDVCIDVGANIGYFAMMMARAAGKQGKVIAFEPVPDTFEVLKLNASLAAEDCGNLEARQAAVSAQAGELVIEHERYSTQNKVRAADATEPGERVPCVTLTSVFEGLKLTKPAALVKIDVEGHELSVIEGALSVLRPEMIQKIILEVTPGQGAEQIEELIVARRGTCHCWVNERWAKMPVSALTERTDVLVTYGA